MMVLEARHITKSFAGVRALDDANFNLRAGEVCGLVGANGSGKTTFARIVSGLLMPDSGELRLYGQTVNLRGRIHAEAYRLAMVHQNLSLVPEMTIWENIALGREQTGPLALLDDLKDIAQAERALNAISAKIPLHERVKNISAVAKQVVEIAKALAKDPQILILDEPTASLDFHQVESLFRAVRKLKENGVSIIFISHRLSEVAKICDRLVAFRNGETVGELDFATQPRDEKLIIPLITGQEVRDRVKKPSRLRQEEIIRQSSRVPALEMRCVSMATALHDVSFTLSRGEVLGLGGLQGQGQEEILMILAGYRKAYKGVILVNGRPLLRRNTRHAIRQGIALIPGDRHKEGLFLEHTVHSNLLYPEASMQPWWSFLLPNARYRRLARDAIEAVSLVPPNPRLTVSQLSGGNQQKVVVGKWLSLDPDILLLNDATKGVDVGARQNLYAIISRLTEKGTSVILYASDNEELINNCDRVLIVFEGRIVKEIEADDISEEKLVVSSLNIEHSVEKSALADSQNAWRP
jgi:ribose transport system ATP-binding protein